MHAFVTGGIVAQKSPSESKLPKKFRADGFGEGVKESPLLVIPEFSSRAGARSLSFPSAAWECVPRSAASHRTPLSVRSPLRRLRFAKRRLARRIPKQRLGTTKKPPKAPSPVVPVAPLSSVLCLRGGGSFRSGMQSPTGAGAADSICRVQRGDFVVVLRVVADFFQPGAFASTGFFGVAALQ